MKIDAAVNFSICNLGLGFSFIRQDSVDFSDGRCHWDSPLEALEMEHSDEVTSHVR